MKTRKEKDEALVSDLNVLKDKVAKLPSQKELFDKIEKQKEKASRAIKE